MRYLITFLVAVHISGVSQSVSAFDWQSNWENTWGYSMMSPKERSYFENEVRNLTTMKECMDLLKHHNIVIQQRIDDWGVNPRRTQPVDTCSELHAQGLLSD